MGRKFDKKNRNVRNRRQKPVILITAEGRNVTETLYFRSFQEQHADYHIEILRQGHVTDPEGMLEKIDNYWKDNDLSEERGDIAFVVLDLDCDQNKARLVKKLAAKSKPVFIASNPCFEVWFLLHFRFSTHQFTGNNEVLRSLNDYIPGYCKNMDVSGTLKNTTDHAMANAEKLTKHYKTLGFDWPSADCNPRTDVPVIINAIRERN